MSPMCVENQEDAFVAALLKIELERLCVYLVTCAIRIFHRYCYCYYY